jgi:hypothetical protein
VDSTSEAARLIESNRIFIVGAGGNAANVSPRTLGYHAAGRQKRFDFRKKRVIYNRDLIALLEDVDNVIKMIGYGNFNEAARSAPLVMSELTCNAAQEAGEEGGVIGSAVYCLP